jgi:hypothetical protein
MPPPLSAPRVPPSLLHPPLAAGPEESSSGIDRASLDVGAAESTSQEDVPLPGVDDAWLVPRADFTLEVLLACAYPCRRPRPIPRSHAAPPASGSQRGAAPVPATRARQPPWARNAPIPRLPRRARECSRLCPLPTAPRVSSSGLVRGHAQRGVQGSADRREGGASAGAGGQACGSLHRGGQGGAAQPVRARAPLRFMSGYGLLTHSATQRSGRQCRVGRRGDWGFGAAVSVEWPTGGGDWGFGAGVSVGWVTGTRPRRQQNSRQCRGGGGLLAVGAG